jgi:hypothetical protein
VAADVARRRVGGSHAVGRSGLRPGVAHRTWRRSQSDVLCACT